MNLFGSLALFRDAFAWRGGACRRGNGARGKPSKAVWGDILLPGAGAAKDANAPEGEVSLPLLVQTAEARWRRKRPWLWMVLLGCLLAWPPAAAGEPGRVEAFSPRGEVKAPRQVAARFSTDMTAFGDPRPADPFVVSCPEPGTGRWVNHRTWVYDFDRAVPGGIRCTFALRPGLRDLDGGPVAGEQSFAFSTGGPAVLSCRPGEGSEDVDEEQVFVLFLDAEPEEASVVQHAFFVVEGLAERVGVRLLTGPARKRILQDLRLREKSDGMAVIQARQAFPPQAEVQLVWGRGIRSRSGVAATEDQVLAFKVREPFRAEFSCSREKAGAACIPLLPLRLAFSAPVPGAAARQIVLQEKAGKRWFPVPDSEDEGSADVRRLVFPGPFPEKTSYVLTVPPTLRDDAGRPLANAGLFPLAVSTDAYPPLAKFSAPFGIVEADPATAVPVTLRNLEKEVAGQALALHLGQRIQGRLLRTPADVDGAVLTWLRALAGAERETSVLGRRGTPLRIPKPGGEKAFEVLGIPLAGPGFYVVELESRILGTHLLERPAPLYVPTGVLATNLAAHFQWGRESSLVWVTTLADGKPAEHCDVAVRDCRGQLLWQGKTDADGLARIARALPPPEALPRCPGKVNYREASRALTDIHGGLFVFVRRKGDMTFTHSSWNDGIEPWRFQLPAGDAPGPDSIQAHTVFDRPLFRAGEAVHMKHLLRVRTGGGFALASPNRRPGEAVLRHRGSEEIYRLPLAWRSGGAAETVWTIPPEAKLGLYDVFLVQRLPPAQAPGEAGQGGEEAEREWRSGSFRVEEFRVPLMQGVIQARPDPLVADRAVDLDLSVSFLAGGAAFHLPVALRAQVEPRSVSFPEHEGFVFEGGRLREGVVTPGEEGAGEDIPPEDASAGEGARPIRLPGQQLELDGTGQAHAVFPLPAVDTPRHVRVEMEFRDPNGEIQTASSRIPLYPAARLVGVRPAVWTASRDKLCYQVLVTDLQGRPVADAPVAVDLYRQEYRSHRVRLVGGFYAYRHVRETRRLLRHATGKTDRQGLLACEGPAPAAGSLVIHAETQDPAGRTAMANAGIWVAGSEDWWFEARNDDRMDVVPEKKRYEPGERARFQVRMPFRAATALVAVVREGVLDAFVTPLSGNDATIEVPVRPAYAPNVFVSVLAVRGRAGEPRPTAVFDPGRPAYRLGIASLRVGWKPHELRVRVETDRLVYRVRDAVEARIAVERSDGGPLPPDAEVAVAAVDEGLLQLRPNESWNVLPAMMALRPCEVQTATAQSLVVGKRHFGLKALPQGGGGGRQMTRELFDTLLFWKGRVPLDNRGRARVRIPLNDALTRFRIVAVATAGAGLFGTGETGIQSTQDLMILAGLPPLVREGDRFPARFTLRNTTSRNQELAAVLAVEDGFRREVREPVAVTLAPGEARELAWPMTAPLDRDRLVYELAVHTPAGDPRDRLKTTQAVVPAEPVRTVQATLAQVREPLRLSAARPAGALPGRGGISLALQNSIRGTLAGVRQYMAQYPYGCLEQRISRAVALRDRREWDRITALLPAYSDADGFLKYFPNLREGSEVLTAHVLSLGHEAGYALPEERRQAMLDALAGFVAGKRARRGSVPAADLTIRKLAALEALSRHRAVSASLLDALALAPRLWPTSALLDWLGVLQRVPEIPQRSRRLAEAQEILRARLQLQGTFLGFSTERTDRLWWLMAGPDCNAVRAILALLPLPAWQGDLPRIVRGAVGRMQQGRWDTTAANAWGVLALERFAVRFEAETVTGGTGAALGKEKAFLSWTGHPEGGRLFFPWPAGTETLEVRHDGAGAPWAVVQSLAAVPLQKPLDSGFRVRRSVVAVERREGGSWRRGDILRVRLDLLAAADMTWVVVHDPIPAGSTILRSDLGGGADILTQGEKRGGGVWESFAERSHEAFRVYYAFVPQGAWFVEYTLRLNQDGTFHLPPTRVEALYAPEMRGETPNAPVKVFP